MNNQQYVFCQNCGKKVKVGTKFCPRCGHPINTPHTESNNHSTRNQDPTKTGLNQDPTKATRNSQSRINSQQAQPIHTDNVKATAQNKMNGLLNMKQDTEREEAENARKEESLSLQERTYIDNKVANNAPSTGVTYLLGIFLFEFGAPQWYLHHNVAGTLILINSFVLIWIFGLGAIINGIWWFVDLFLYPMYVNHSKAKIKRQAINEVIMLKH